MMSRWMQTASSSSHVVTTLGAVNGKAGEFHVLKSLPSITEMRRTIALLKKYQIIEPLDVLEELNESRPAWSSTLVSIRYF